MRWPLLLLALVVTVAVTVVAAQAQEPPPGAAASQQVELLDGKTIGQWRAQSRLGWRRALRAEAANRRFAATVRAQRIVVRNVRAENKRLRLTVRPNVVHAINLAATVYGVSAYEMHRVASCESGHNPAARNGIYRGVFQEGPMFERGPFARFGVWDPYANAFTAAFTVAREGWRQWACKPR